MRNGVTAGRPRAGDLVVRSHSGRPRLRAAHALSRGLLCIATLASAGAAAQDAADDPERGLPLIHNMVPAMFDSPATPIGAQAFDLERLPDGAVLVGNNEGLLRLDGTGWRTWDPLRGAVLSVAARADGRVFLGGVGDFGYFDRFGDRWVSLKPWSERIGRPFGEVWAIVAGPEATYFVDRARVYRWQSDRLVLVYEGRGEMRQAVGFGAHTLVFDPAAGLVQIDAVEAKLLPGSQLMADQACAITAEGAEVVSVCSDGLLRTWSERGLEREVEIDALPAQQMAEAGISALAPLSGHSYAVGTRRGGLFLVGDDGRFLGNLSQLAGYDNTRIFSLLALGVDGLWIGRDHGLALVEWPGQISRYDVGLGLPRNPLGVVRLGGKIHIVNSRGIHRLDSTGSGFAAAVPQALSDEVVFDFASTGNAIFAAAREGLFELTEAGVQRIDTRLSYVVHVLGHEPLRLLVGGERSAWVLERSASGWRALGDITGVRAEIRRVTAEAPNVVWLSSRSAHQLLRVKLGAVSEPDWQPASAQVDDFSHDPSAPQGPVLPLRTHEGLVFGSRAGIFRFDPAQRRFDADPALNAMLPLSEGEVRDAVPLEGGRVLFVQHDRYRALRRDATGWSEETTPLARVPRGSPPRSIYVEDDGTLWVTTSDAVYRHRPEVQSALPTLPPPRIEAVDGSGRTTPLRPESDMLRGTAPMRLAFRFSTAVFVAAEQVRFRSRLIPLESDWGPWSASPQRELAQVPGGDYRLEVQAKDMFGRISATTRVFVHLEAPWYLRAWAMATYATFMLIAVALLIRVRERRLRTLAAELEDTVRDRTHALETLSVTDQLTGLHNRRYFDRAAARLEYEQPAVLVALIDIDHFKRINDGRGHEAGDRVLQQVAVRLTEAAPHGAALFRWGGEEFLLLAPLRAGDEDPGAIARRVLERIGDQPVTLGVDDVLAVTCSIGWEVATALDEFSMRQALRQADIRLYGAKDAGRDRAHGPNGVTYVRRTG